MTVIQLSLNDNHMIIVINSLHAVRYEYLRNGYIIFAGVFSSFYSKCNSLTGGGENNPTNDVKTLIMHITKRNISKPFN